MPSNCFQSFIKGGGYSSHQHQHNDEYNEDLVPEAPKNRYGYTTTRKVNDSFQTDRTGRSDSTNSTNGRRNGKNQHQRKGNRVAAICRMKISPHQRDRDTLGGRALEGQHMMDDVSFSQRSQVGLLHSGTADSDFLSSSFGIDTERSFDADVQDEGSGVGSGSGVDSGGQLGVGADINMDNWTHTNTRTSATSVTRSTSTGTQTHPHRPQDSASTGTLSHSSRSRSRPNNNKSEEQFEDISKTNDKPSGFKGCVPKLKKNREDNKPIDLNHAYAHAHAQHHSYAQVMPHIPEVPEGAQLPKYDTSMVVGQQGQSNFPQIVFANANANINANREEYEFAPQREHLDGMPRVRPFSAYEKKSHEERIAYDGSMHNHIQKHSHSHPNPHPHQYDTQLYQHQHQYEQHETSFDSYRNTASPIQSDREYRHEEFFLDNLANTLTTNYEDLQQNIYELTGKSQAQRMMDQALHEERAVPEAVDADQSDLVSEFGMGSTSGGRYNDNANVFEQQHQQQKVDDNDYGPSRSRSMPMRANSNRGGNHNHAAQRVRNERWGEPQDTRGSRVPRSEIDQRTMQWMQQGQQGGGRRESENYHNNVNYAQQYTAEYSDPRHHEEQARYEDLGLDRINTGNYRPRETFEASGGETGHNINIRSSANPNIRTSSSRMNNQKNYVGDMNMASPTNMNSRPRPRKSDAVSKWREGRQSHTTAGNGNDGVSLASSSASPFSRSNKYREIQGTPYKITKDDRKNSIESTQTQKWSNTSQQQHRRDPRVSMATHMEEDYQSIYSESSQLVGSHLVGHHKAPPRRSPRAVADEYTSPDNFEYEL